MVHGTQCLYFQVAAAGLTLPAVLAARALVGLGEGAALPVMNNLVATNIAPGRRATALGGCFSGFHTGNLVGLVLAPLLLARVGWRGLFYTFGLLGAPLLVLWLATVPPQTPRVSGSASGAGRAPLSTLQLMSKSATWAIIVVNVVNHWGVHDFLAILPLPCPSVNLVACMQATSSTSTGCPVTSTGRWAWICARAATWPSSPGSPWPSDVPSQALLPMASYHAASRPLG